MAKKEALEARAEELGILESIEGSGEGGAVLVKDLEEAIEAHEAANAKPEDEAEEELPSHVVVTSRVKTAKKTYPAGSRVPRELVHSALRLNPGLDATSPQARRAMVKLVREREVQTATERRITEEEAAEFWAA